MKKQITYLILSQIIIGCVISALSLFHSNLAALSSLKGTSVMVLGNLFFAWMFFRAKKGIFSPGKILKSFFIGEIGKFAILIIGVILWAKFGELDWLFLILGVFGVYLANWFALFWFK